MNSGFQITIQILIWIQFG